MIEKKQKHSTTEPSEAEKSRLFDLAAHGKWLAVEELLKSGRFDVNANVLGYPTLFDIALSARNLEITKMLVERGAKIDLFKHGSYPQLKYYPGSKYWEIRQYLWSKSVKSGGDCYQDPGITITDSKDSTDSKGKSKKIYEYRTIVDQQWVMGSTKD